MSSSALDQLEQWYPDIIDGLPTEFDSHMFILALAQRHQRSYAQALVDYAHTDKPFMIVHGEIARRLLNHADLVRKVGEHDSQDIFGQVDSAVIWRKHTADG
jgi:hypothetical protein